MHRDMPWLLWCLLHHVVLQLLHATLQPCAGAVGEQDSGGIHSQMMLCTSCAVPCCVVLLHGFQMSLSVCRGLQAPCKGGCVNSVCDIYWFA